MWLVLPVVLGQDSWEVVRESGGCVFRRGPTEAENNSPLHATCTWADIDAGAIEALISAYSDHDDTWASIATCEEVERTDEQVRVHHVHDLPGVDDREIELTWTWSSEDDGATRHDWVRSPVQPEVDPSRVNPDRDEGYYRILPAEDGVVVEALFYYDPAGSIPEWIVRATQVGSADFMMQELYRAAAVVE
ncbi:MAG TPA: hypothetical protein QGF58_18310 [Myxococcota bacterium]|nr:hypothetical protein [Myxococcota bacterium]